MKKILSFVLCLVIFSLCLYTGGFSLTASAATSGITGECYWTLDGTKLTISGNGRMENYFTTMYMSPWGTNITEVVIEHGVKSIGDYAFHLCHSLKKVTIPKSVTSIGDAAFYLCNELTDLTIPNSVTHIGFGAFFACFKLNEICIPESVTSISRRAFGLVASEVTVDENNKYFCSVDGILFNKDKTTILRFPEYNGYKSYTIPDGVTCIGDDAFYGHFDLEKIIIPNTVKTIGSYAFNNCDIRSVIIPDGVTTIEEFTFAGCHYLKSIVIPDSVTFIDEYAFDGTLNIKDVWYTGDENSRENIIINNENGSLLSATWHYNSCPIAGQHSYDNDCDTNCNECDATRAINHNYDDEDLYCSVCGTEFPPNVSGDVNRDGVINNKDYGMLMQHINKWTVKISLLNSDVNGDNIVNNKDLGLMMQYINKWNVELK